MDIKYRSKTFFFFPAQMELSVFMAAEWLNLWLCGSRCGLPSWEHKADLQFSSMQVGCKQTAFSAAGD